MQVTKQKTAKVDFYVCEIISWQPVKLLLYSNQVEMPVVGNCKLLLTMGLYYEPGICNWEGYNKH